MNSYKAKNQMIPRDKAKSLVIFIIAGLSALLAGGLLMAGGKLLKVELLLYLGYIIFIADWVVGAVVWVVLVLGFITGRY